MSCRAGFVGGALFGALLATLLSWQSAPTPLRQRNVAEGLRPPRLRSAEGVGFFESRREEVRLLRAEVAQLRARDVSPAAARACDGPAAVAAPRVPAVPANTSQLDGQRLLRAHGHWDWRAIVKEVMQLWPSVEAAQLETAVAACHDNGTMYCQRMQVYKGSLYLTDYRAIFFDRHYAPARIMPMLEVMRLRVRVRVW